MCAQILSVHFYTVLLSNTIRVSPYESNTVKQLTQDSIKDVEAGLMLPYAYNHTLYFKCVCE